MWFCVSVIGDGTMSNEYREGVKHRVAIADPGAVFDPEGNPKIFWVKTNLLGLELRNIDGVEDVSISYMNNNRRV